MGKKIIKFDDTEITNINFTNIKGYFDRLCRS